MALWLTKEKSPVLRSLIALDRGFFCALSFTHQARGEGGLSLLKAYTGLPEPQFKAWSPAVKSAQQLVRFRI